MIIVQHHSCLGLSSTIAHPRLDRYYLHLTLARAGNVPRHLLHLQPRAIHLFLQMQIYGLKVKLYPLVVVFFT